MVLSLSGVFNLVAVTTGTFQYPAGLATSINERVKNGEKDVEPYGLIIELKDLEGMDSAGLGTILGVVKRMAVLGQPVRLCSVGTAIMDFLTLNRSSLLEVIDEHLWASLEHFQGYY